MNCGHCGARRPHGAHRIGWRCGLCRCCYRRWQNHGYPAAGPPAERVQVAGGSAAGRLEDYAELRSWGLSSAEAATRMKVTRRTVQRYEAVLRDRDTERIAA